MPMNISIGLLSRVLVVSMLTFCYSNVFATQLLTDVQDESIAVLSVVEEKVINVFETIEQKTTNTEIDAQLRKTKQEIQLLIEQQQEALEDTVNTTQVAEIMQETKERIILKTYDAVTDRDPLQETIHVPGGDKEQEEAVETALDQIVAHTTVSIQIKTTTPPDKVKESFIKYDDDVTIKELISTDGVYYLEVTIPKD
jgi:hypothetical protein